MDDFPDLPPPYEEAVLAGPPTAQAEPGATSSAVPPGPSPAYNPAWISRSQVKAMFGARGTGPGQFRSPVAAAQCPRTGNYVITDMGNHRIQIWTQDFQHLFTFGNEGGESENLKYPCGVAVDSEGRIYVADTGNNQIKIFDVGGRCLKVCGCKGTGPGEFRNPYGLTIAPNRLLYVCDGDNGRIQVLRPEGTFVNAFCTQRDLHVVSPRDIAAYPDGTLAVSNWTGYVSFFTAQGLYKNTYFGQSGAELKAASGVIATPSYDLALVDKFKNEICILKGGRVTVCGTPGKEPGQFDNPRGALLTRQGYLLVADTGNDRMQVLDVL